MIASDLAARGLKPTRRNHVFNLDVPTLSKAYLHRVGRTARAGAKGTAVSLVTETEPPHPSIRAGLGHLPAMHTSS